MGEPSIGARDIDRYLFQFLNDIGDHLQAPSATVSDSAPSIVTVVPVI